jgi:putative ABC transport system permease protein
LYVGGGDEGIELRIVGVIERLQTPWAQATENSESSYLTATRLGDSGGRYIIRT